MPNRLAAERSPYLKQHADNPVDWYPWGLEALEAARTSNKPIVVSIGYSACHWCHVMAHESFEDPKTAQLMNDLFINIKVDREERPDVDALYMEAVQALTGSGGWPLNVFLTPDLRPYFGGTYFPPDPRHGIASWRDILEGAAAAYRDRPDDVEHNASTLVDYLTRSQSPSQDGDMPNGDDLSAAYRAARSQGDDRLGGFGSAPKFPQPLGLEFVLAEAVQRKDVDGIAFVRHSLLAMAQGGIYDQLGGGFHRYSVDARWLVPHFEKMLYDNALLARLYLHGYQATQNRLFRAVAEETLEYVVRELRSTERGFYSSQDADSEGEEGAFYLWSLDDLDRALEPESNDRRIAAAWFGIRVGGNFERRTILTSFRTVKEIAQELDLTSDEVKNALPSIRIALLDYRSQRARPAIDRKSLVSWNALAIGALAEVGASLQRPDFISAARDAAAFVATLMSPSGRLVRSYLDGPGSVPAFLEDYAYFADALVDLYQATFEPHYLEQAETLLCEAADLFGGDAGDVLFDARVSSELPVRPRSMFDNPIPSGNAAFATAALRLAALTGDNPHFGVIQAIIGAAQPYMARAPLAVPHLLRVIALDIRGATQIALVGPWGSERSLLDRVVQDRYLPYAVVAAGEDMPPSLLVGRSLIDGRATAYVCKSFACRLPVNEPAALNAQLDALNSV